MWFVFKRVIYDNSIIGLAIKLSLSTVTIEMGVRVH